MARENLNERVTADTIHRLFKKRERIKRLQEEAERLEERLWQEHLRQNTASFVVPVVRADGGRGKEYVTRVHGDGSKHEVDVIVRDEVEIYE